MRDWRKWQRTDLRIFKVPRFFKLEYTRMIRTFSDSMECKDGTGMTDYEYSFIRMRCIKIIEKLPYPLNQVIPAFHTRNLFSKFFFFTGKIEIEFFPRFTFIRSADFMFGHPRISRDSTRRETEDGRNQLSSFARTLHASMYDMCNAILTYCFGSSQTLFPSLLGERIMLVGH